MALCILLIQIIYTLYEIIRVFYIEQIFVQSLIVKIAHLKNYLIYFHIIKCTFYILIIYEFNNICILYFLMNLIFQRLVSEIQEKDLRLGKQTLARQYNSSAGIQKQKIFFFLFSHTTWFAGSQFPNQGLNSGHNSETLLPNRWTAREFPRNILSDDLIVDCQEQMNLKHSVQHGYMLCYFTLQLCQGTVK